MKLIAKIKRYKGRGKIKKYTGQGKIKKVKSKKNVLFIFEKEKKSIGHYFAETRRKTRRGGYSN